MHSHIKCHISEKKADESPIPNRLWFLRIQGVFRFTGDNNPLLMRSHLFFRKSISYFRAEFKIEKVKKLLNVKTDFRRQKGRSFTFVLPQPFVISMEVFGVRFVLLPGATSAGKPYFGEVCISGLDNAYTGDIVPVNDRG